MVGGVGRGCHPQTPSNTQFMEGAPAALPDLVTTNLHKTERRYITTLMVAVFVMQQALNKYYSLA